MQKDSTKTRIPPEQIPEVVEMTYLAGGDPEVVARTLEIPITQVLEIIQECLKRWQREGRPDGELKRQRLLFTINRMWDRVDKGNTKAAEVLVTLLGALGDASDPERERLLEELEDAPERKPAKVGDLAEMAHKGGFAGVYWDLRSADPPLNAKQAFFCAWYQVYHANREVLKLDPEMPVSIRKLSKFLGVSIPTLHEWKRKFNNDLGLTTWLDDKLSGMLPRAINQLDRNIGSSSGAVSNQAIKMTVDLYQNRQAAKGQSAGDRPQEVPAIDRGMNEEELDILTDNLLIARSRPIYPDPEEEDDDNSSE